MYKLKHIQLSSPGSRSLLRTFLFCLLLMGSLCTMLPLIFSSQVLAHAELKTRHPHVSMVKPHTVTSAQKGVVARNHALSLRQKDRLPEFLHAQGGASIIHQPTIKVTKDGSAPQNLTITSSAPGGPNFQVGQTLTIELVMHNGSSATTYTNHSGVGMSVTFPVGLSNMVVVTNNWADNISATTSQAIYSSLYIGPPVVPGGVFPQVTISGTLTSAAVPVFTVSPRAFDSKNASVPTGALSINVAPGTATVTPTPTGTVTPTSTPLTSPNVSITANVSGGLVHQVGQTIAVTLTVSNIDTSHSLGANDGVYIGDVLPFGFENISALGGGNWSINTSSTTGPALFTAKYVGSSIAPGGTFPPIIVIMALTSDAVPGVRNSTAVFDNYFDRSSVAAIQLAVNGVGTVLPTPTLPSLPDLSLTQSSVGSNTFRVGQNVTYALNVASTDTSGPVEPSNLIKVVAVFPIGLTNVTMTGSNWTLLATSTSSPTLIQATYRGQYPVATGTQLPPILVQGTVANTAVPQLTSTAVVQVSGDSHPDNNLTNTTIQASAFTPTARSQASLMPTSVVTPTVTISDVAASFSNPLPDLAVTQSTIGSSPFAAGQQLGYVLSVKNVVATGSVASLIRLTEVIPVGLTNVSVSAGAGWRITQSSTASPLLVSATYSGSYPVAPGATLAPLFVIGKVSAGIISSITCTAVVGVAGDLNPSNNLANNTVFVTPSFLSQSRSSEKRPGSSFEGNLIETR